MQLVTVLLEFDDGEQPAFYAYMKALGGKVVGVHFGDALAELEAVEATSNSLPVRASFRLRPTERCPRCGFVQVVPNL